MAKRKGTKKKVFTVLGIVCAVLIVASVLWIQLKPPAALEVAYANASVGDITQVLETSGKVVGENPGNYDILDGIKVLEVHVGVGERIHAGQLLATFDEQALNSELAKKQQAYNAALSTYQNCKDSAAAARQQLKQVNDRIAEIDKEIAKRNEQSANTTTPTQPSVSLPDSLLNSLRGLLQGDLSQVMQGMQSIGNLMGGGSALGYDMSAILGSMGTSSLDMEKMQLQLQVTMLEAQSSDAFSGIYESLVDSAKAALDETRAVIDQARGGWVAQHDGLVREVNITAGEVFKNENGGSSQQMDVASILALMQGNSAGLGDMVGSLMGGSSKTYGMRLEYFPLTATVIFNKFDVLKVQVGQRATISTPAGNQIEGELTFINPVAESSGGMDIGSILGSGGSESGVSAKISIPYPDESVIIGLEVGISLEVSSAESAVLIPIEAVMRNENGNFVWKYDSETRTAVQVPVELGLLSKTSRQVISGITADDIVLTRVPSELTEERRVRLK